MKVSKVALVKALAYMVIGLCAGLLVVNTLRVPVPGETTDYRMLFTSSEGLLPGNPVTMSGVRIGRVEDIALRSAPDGTALSEVTVSISRDHQLPQSITAAIRYADMLGARYIAISRAPDGANTADSTIPVTATSAPVDLTALMNGFSPLFAVLDPDQVNQLARGFVDTFAGRTSSVQLLLNQIAAMGRNLSANSTVFTQLITNLSAIAGTTAQRTPQLVDLFSGLSQLTSAIVGDNRQFTTLLDSGDRALSSLAQMMTAAGNDFPRALNTLRDVTAAWIPNTARFNDFLTNLPKIAGSINRSGRYGGFMMLYLCNFTLKAFDLEANIFGPLHSPVCR